ncbi:MAG: hypothetical protein R3E96_08355 [Planctomycetota bacterium]
MASFRRLESRWQLWRSEWQRQAAVRGAWAQAAQVRAQQLAEQVARDAMPMGPVLDAFRTVLDRRPGLVRGTYRKGLRWASTRLDSVWQQLRGKRAIPEAAPDTLLEAEWTAVRALWPTFVEGLPQALKAADPGADGELERRLLEDCGGARLADSLAWLRGHMERDKEAWTRFTERAEQLIEAELAQRGDEWLWQVLLDLTHLVPAAVAGVIVVHTGGLLPDLAVGSAGALSSLAGERLSKFLGTQVASRAREAWVQLRRDSLCDWILQGALPQTWPVVSAPMPEAGARLLQWLETPRAPHD